MQRKQDANHYDDLISTQVYSATSSGSLLISVGRLEVTMLKMVSAVSCFRNGSSRASSFLPFETSRNGRNSTPESLNQNISENVQLKFSIHQNAYDDSTASF